ncbi:MAG: hypothetical protein M5R40_15640 [Anaerolineae bacterium]|nr:hypothetical protein [Anaerolineae bacterium]
MSEIPTRQKLVIAFACAVVVAFVLPWLEFSGFVSGTDSGLSLAQTSESAASGMDLRIFFLTPVAALLCLVLCVPAVRKRMGILAPVSQIILVVVGLAPLPTLWAEVETWSGSTVSSSFGLWITIAAMVGIAAGALVDLLAARRGD